MEFLKKLLSDYKYITDNYTHSEGVDQSSLKYNLKLKLQKIKWRYRAYKFSKEGNPKLIIYSPLWYEASELVETLGYKYQNIDEFYYGHIFKKDNEYYRLYHDYKKDIYIFRKKNNIVM